MELHLNNSVAYALATTLNLLRKRFNSKISCLNLSSEQYGVLKIIDEKGSLTPTNIAQILQRDKATITRIINSLEKKGFIVKKKINNRSFVVEMSKEGYEQFKNADKIALEFHKKIKEVLSEKEFDLLLDSLNKIKKEFE